MKTGHPGVWLGTAAAVVAAVAGLSASDAVHGGAFAGLLAGSLCAVWGIAHADYARRQAHLGR